MSGHRGWAAPRPWLDDEEMAKKDDDLALGHRKSKMSTRQGGGSWQAAARTPRRSSFTRLALYGAIMIGLVYFWLHMPSAPAHGFHDLDDLHAGLEPLDSRWQSAPRDDYSKRTSGRDDAKGAKPEVDRVGNRNAPLRLPHLGKSVYAISALGGSMAKNPNILFAAASLQSAATLLPMACQMAAEELNYVHFALMGQSTISMKELLQLNGVDDACSITLHDARPDHPTTSSDTRLMLSTARALYHINMYMHPQAIFVDSTKTEKNYFLLGLRDQIRATKAALIELPESPATRLSWLTKLDSSALAAWNDVHFDILVHAPRVGTGNLSRLLKSLARADLSSVSVPHLTVELPSDIELQTERLLNEFRWPPRSWQLIPPTPMLSLRRRIPRLKMSEEESSVRFLESFWPIKPSHSHVLILSPHIEVTPQFFHYVKYTLLHNLYTAKSDKGFFKRQLMAIGLSIPTTNLDGSKVFIPPQAKGDGKAESQGTPFLWQAPNSDATIFLGDKWVELHHYVTQVLEKQHTAAATSALFTTKEVGKTYPAWLEYALQLSRLRGYFTLYPGQETAKNIVGVHTDLRDKPEEYQGETQSGDGPDSDLSDEATDTFDAGSQVTLVSTLPNDGRLPLLQDVPMLSWDSQEANMDALRKDALLYSSKFRREVGQCEDAETDPVHLRDASDLFCNTKAKA